MTIEGVSLEEVRAAKGKAAEVFRALVGEVAVGIAPAEKGLYRLKVNLTDPPAKGVTLPDAIDGVPVQIEVVGRIHKR
jgi:hypothetical protein